MEREAEWASGKVSVDAAEENGGAVDVTKTKQNGSRQAWMEQQSVYLVGDEGVWKCRHCIWTYQLCGPRIGHIQKHEVYCHEAMDTETLTQHGPYSTSPVKGSLSTDGTSAMKIRQVNHSINGKNKIQVNGKTEFRTEESNNLENALVSEETSDRRSTDVILENGSSSNILSNGYNEIGVGRSELEIEEDTRVELVKKSKQVVAEIDLKRVLEEQETHDLYCPNCRSCITKRVILIKRKRTSQETQYDTPSTKVQRPDLYAATASVDEMTELNHDTEPDVFRCLSCFSFFIPTDTGFNVFRIFGRRETENQSSQLPPAKTEITSPPIFKPEGIRIGTNESGVQFGVESNNNSGKDPSFKEKQSLLIFSAMGDSGARNIEEGQSTNAEKAADGVARVSFISNGKKVADPAESSMLINPNKTESEATIVGNNQVMTDTGFNIFRVFGRRETENQLSSQLSHGKTEITSPPIFKPAEIISGASEAGGDVRGTINIVTSSERTSLISQNINASVPPSTMVSTHTETHIYLGERSAGDGTRKNWDVLKSIVYGGLIESLTSLTIVSSAAGSDASTLNIVALGLANLIGGLFVIAHNLSELRTAQEDAIDKNGEPVGRYWELLGRKANFRLHATVAVLTYMLVGLLPPLIYGFSFRKSDSKEYKLIVVAAASFVCTSLLALGKAHVNARKHYIKSLAFYLSLSFAASGLSYVAGVMINRLLVQLGLFDSSAVIPVPPPASDIYHGIASTLEAWASSRAEMFS